MYGALPYFKGLKFSNFDLTLFWLDLEAGGGESLATPIQCKASLWVFIWASSRGAANDCSDVVVLIVKCFLSGGCIESAAHRLCACSAHIYSVRFYTSAAFKCSHFTAEVISNSSFQRGNVNCTMSPFLPLIKTLCQDLEETLTCSILLDLTARFCNLDIQPSAE